MRRVGGLIIALALGTGLFALTKTAQGQDYADRKVITGVAPAYPELARHMHVGGVVKLEIVIRANGRVKSSKVVGGNPVLIESAAEAVRQWTFEAAREETSEIVEVTFTAHYPHRALWKALSTESYLAWRSSRRAGARTVLGPAFWW